MKPFQKVLAVLIAVVLAVSMASCGSISLSKQWSYKYGDTKYDIGVYIYALYSSYLSAQSYAEKVDGYKEDESFLDLKITDDDGEKAVARDWILEKADEAARELVALDKLIEVKGATWDEASVATAKQNAQDAWDMGPYAMYGANYYNPLSKQLEPFGISFDSFVQLYASQTGNTPYTIKTAALFDSYYSAGGSDEVSDEDLTAFFLENYADYSYIPVNLYESTTDSDGNSTNSKFSDKKIEIIKGKLEGFAKEINSGSADFDAVAEKCKTKYSVSDDSLVKDKVEALEDLESSDKDMFAAVKGLKVGKASVIVTGTDGDTPVAYVIVKNNVEKDTNEYISGSNRVGVLQNMKSDDFRDIVSKEAKALDKDDKFEKNEGAINGYKPEMFYQKPDKTTSDDDSDDSDDEGSES